MICQVTVRWWKVYLDSASKVRGSGVVVVLVSFEGVRVEKSLRLGFRASNNEAKYKALISGLRAAQKLRAEEVEVLSDSRLMVSQVDGGFKARD